MNKDGRRSRIIRGGRGEERDPQEQNQGTSGGSYWGSSVCSIRGRWVFRAHLGKVGERRGGIKATGRPAGKTRSRGGEARKRTERRGTGRTKRDAAKRGEGAASQKWKVKA